VAATDLQRRTYRGLTFWESWEDEPSVVARRAEQVRRLANVEGTARPRLLARQDARTVARVNAPPGRAISAAELAARVKRNPGRLSAAMITTWLLERHLAVEHDGRLVATPLGRAYGAMVSDEVVTLK
jgi:hypothetical protein